MKKILLIFAIIFSFLSCKKENFNIEYKNMDTLKVDDTFNWKTTEEYNFIINTETTALMVIQSTSGINYLKLFLNKDMENNFMLTLPSYENEVYIMFNGKKIKKELNNQQIKENF